MPTLLAASVAVPYAATQAPQWDWSAVTQWTAAAPEAPPAASFASLEDIPSPAEVYQKYRAPLQGPGLLPTTKPLEGLPTYGLHEVLRMDVSKEWVYQRWPRKSNATADLDLLGVRVPLVTGTQMHDVAGSLTYYFNSAGQVQKLAFKGRAGDPRAVIALATGPYGLQPAPAPPGAQLWQLRRGPDVISQLRIESAPVVWESAPHDVFAIDLVLQRPQGARPINDLDEAVAEMLQQQQQQLQQKLAAIPPPAPPPPPAAAPAAASATPGAAKAADPAPSEATWETWFPRSRLSKEQTEQFYQTLRGW